MNRKRTNLKDKNHNEPLSKTKLAANTTKFGCNSLIPIH
jgi:hypothetical protein